MWSEKMYNGLPQWEVKHMNDASNYLLPYEQQKKLTQLHHLLLDAQSRDNFWARMQYDAEPSMTNAMRMVQGSGLTLEEQAKRANWKAEYLKVEKKILLYGTSFTGKVIATALQLDQLDFFGFCGRRANAFPDGLMGKPVVSPEYLFAHANEFAVIIAAADRFDEVHQILRENHFPENQILSWFNIPARGHQYFDFPHLFSKGTAFVDCGCFDGGDSIYFSEWCDGQYSKIFAFEPDSDNYQKCCQRTQGLRDFQLIQAGLSNRKGTAAFVKKGTMVSHILNNEEEPCFGEKIEEIQLVTLDETLADNQIGFIKMDIEGAEYDALHGAEKIISRDRPFLALALEHRFGDVAAVMEYLHELVPEYRFRLWCYGPAALAPVLYAAVETP